jgi:uncharacterized membrane protein
MVLERRTTLWLVAAITGLALMSTGVVDETGDATPLLWIGVLLLPLGLLLEVASWYRRRQAHGDETLL